MRLRWTAAGIAQDLVGTVTQSSGHTINGYGAISANLTNKGLVNANAVNNTLFVNGASMSNSATMEATTGVLVFTSGVAVTNAGGVISANGNNVYLTGATITGGTLNSPSGEVEAINSTSNTLNGVTNNGQFGIQGASNISTTGTTTNNGTITINTNSSASSTLSAGGPLAGTGTVAINGGGLLAFSTGVGASTLGGLTIANGGQLDVKNNHIFIDYGSGPDPIASIAALLKSGFNGGAWNGSTGIITTAPLVSGGLTYGLGYADAADSEDGATGLPSGNIEIKYTLLGDADLNGIVNGIDFGILAANFNKGVTGWDEGDFDYNNIVNGLDFGDLAANFNKGAAGTAVAGGSALDDPALVAFAEANGLMADVPEPTMIGLGAVMAAGMLARRRRRH